MVELFSTDPAEKGKAYTLEGLTHDEVTFDLEGFIKLDATKKVIVMIFKYKDQDSQSKTSNTMSL